MKKMRANSNVRQRQKMSRRMIAFVSAFCLAFAATGLVIFINLTHVEKSVAQQASTFMIENESFVTDMALPNTVVKQHPLFGDKTQFTRKAEAIESSQTNMK